MDSPLIAPARGEARKATTSAISEAETIRRIALFSAIRAQLRQIRSPRGIFTPRYQGRAVGEDVLSSVISLTRR